MKRNLRRFFWFLKAFLRKYLKVIIVGLALGVFFARFAYLLPRPKPCLRIGLIGRYSPEDLPWEVLQNISRGLVKIKKDGWVAPDLAENWEVKDQGKQYLFHLRKGVYWQDGTPLSAKDIHYHLENVQVKALDDQTLAFKLKEPFSPFPTILNQPVFKKGLLGVGKYRVTAIKSSGNFVQSIKLESNNLTLVYKFYPTEKAAVLGFKLGEIDRIENITDPYDLKNWPKIKIKPIIRQDEFVAVFFNTRDKDSPLADKTVRQALAYAIEKPKDQSRAFGPLNPHSWAYNSQVKPYLKDLAKAKSLLKEVKIEKMELELMTSISQLKHAEEIKNDWEKIGVKTNIKVVSALSDDFQALLISQKIPADPDQYTLWHSTQNTNITGYNNPRVDKLLEDGRKTEDMKKRKEIYLDFQRFLVEDAPAIFLFHPTVYIISR